MAKYVRDCDLQRRRGKNALVSYITAPVRLGPHYQQHMFSNAGIARSIVKVLVQMGYTVDLIDWTCQDFESDKDYDLFFGHAGANWEYLSRNVVGVCTGSSLIGVRPSGLIGSRGSTACAFRTTAG